MTLAELLTNIQSKPNFIKWAKAPVVIETIGDIEKYQGVAYISTPDGTNTVQVFMMVDKANNQATWQTNDQLEMDKNVDSVKMNALRTYLKANFAAFFITNVDLVNNWAEAITYSASGADLTKSTVLVYKMGANPIAHKKIV